MLLCRSVLGVSLLIGACPVAPSRTVTLWFYLEGVIMCSESYSRSSRLAKGMWLEPSSDLSIRLRLVVVAAMGQ
jgi:hypothetical protein